MLVGLLQDVRYAARSLRLSPGFVLVAVVSLALGTGANTAIFQLLDAIRLRSLPVRAPQELVELRTNDMDDARGSWMRSPSLTNPQWEEIRKRQDPFSGMLAWADEPFELATVGESREAAGLWVSGDLFRVLGINPILGRVFSVEDDRRGCGTAPGAVISYGFWQREFGADREVVGRSIRIGRNQFAVAGVTPRGFFGLEVGKTFDIGLPICSEPSLHGAGRLDSGTTWWLTVLGRLKSGVSMSSASAFFDARSGEIFRQTLPTGYPSESVKSYLAMRLVAWPAGEGLSRLRETYSRALILLFAIAGLVLLVACANLANLMLARASARQHEVALRLAVGASPLRVARQGIVESLLLAIAGAGLGLLVARGLSAFLVSFLTSANDAGTFVDLSPDWRIFGFAAGLALLTSAVFALAPVLRTVGTDAADALKAGSRTMTSGRNGATFRRFLVASQIAIALVLLVGTLLFVRSLRNLQAVDAGFDQHGLLFADVTLTGSRTKLLQRVRAIPGVAGAAEVGIVPLTGGNWNNRMWMDDSDKDHARVAMRNMVGPGYFLTLKTPIVAGREFEERDLSVTAKVAVVNEEFARLFAGGPAVVGRRLWIEATPYEPQTALEIVGVVKNTKYEDLREEFLPTVFVPPSPGLLNSSRVRMMIRSGVAPEAMIPAVRKAITGVSPDAQYSFRVFEAWVEESLLRERLMATLSTMFGLLALVLTAVGVYGVTAYTVALRKTEIGIRIALGADRGAVMSLILREAVLVCCMGLAAGLVIALNVGRAAGALLFGMPVNDALTICTAATSLFAITMMASGWPAWRAFRADPARELRQN